MKVIPHLLATFSRSNGEGGKCSFFLCLHTPFFRFTRISNGLILFFFKRREKNSTERYIGRKRSKKPHEGGPAKRRRHVEGETLYSS